MVDESALASIFSATTGIWTIAGILALTTWRLWNGLPAVMAQWVAWRQAKMADKLARDRAAADAKAADWERLRERLQHVEAAHQKCEGDLLAEREQRVRDISGLRDEIATERAERVRLERLMFAEGEIRQAQAAAAAEVRQDAADRAKGKRP